MAERHEFPDDSVFGWLDPEIEELAGGRAIVTFPHHDGVTNPDSDVVNGGVVSTLVDTACGMAISTQVDEPGGQTTIDLSTSYLRPATDDITAEAEVIRTGSSVAVARAVVTTLHEGERTDVAVGRATFRIF